MNDKRPAGYYCTKYPLTRAVFLSEMQEGGGTLLFLFFSHYPNRVATEEEEQVNDALWEIYQISKKARADVLSALEKAGIKDRLIGAHLEVLYD